MQNGREKGRKRGKGESEGMRVGGCKMGGSREFMGKMTL